MKKFSSLVVSFVFLLGIFSPTVNAAESNFCDQYKGVTKIWWDGIELKPGQIGRLTVKQDTPLFKLQGEKKVFSRTLKAGEFYRIYAFKPGMLSVGGGYYVDRDARVTYQTPSKTKLQAVQCIVNNPVIKIKSVDLSKEVIAVKNEGYKDVTLTGWKIVSVEGNQTYYFPEGFVLKTGSTVFVTSGPGAKDQAPSYLKWTNANMLNNAGDVTRLYNPKGEKVSEIK
ncbi:lamin tail domain-containing protein [Cytobacillus pseudoceanisediminis]|uniref:lamin tail domain-containing protein n=1 Tax=Cytobacillus TaxID=2675230 RepID=UPI0009F51DCA|nr:lamin tail domain-containing protein [Cytobacillus oceanisediminis]